jgi:hypothetical protein
MTMDLSAVDAPSHGLLALQQTKGVSKEVEALVDIGEQEQKQETVVEVAPQAAVVEEALPVSLKEEAPPEGNQVMGEGTNGEHLDSHKEWGSFVSTVASTTAALQAAAAQIPSKEVRGVVNERRMIDSSNEPVATAANQSYERLEWGDRSWRNGLMDASGSASTARKGSRRQSNYEAESGRRGSRRKGSGRMSFHKRRLPVELPAKPPTEAELAVREGRRRAYEVLLEMVASEEEYVLNLHYLMTCFITPLQLHELSAKQETQAGNSSWWKRGAGGGDSASGGATVARGTGGGDSTSNATKPGGGTWLGKRFGGKSSKKSEGMGGEGDADGEDNGADERAKYALLNSAAAMFVSSIEQINTLHTQLLGRLVDAVGQSVAAKGLSSGSAVVKQALLAPSASAMLAQTPTVTSAKTTTAAELLPVEGSDSTEIGLASGAQLKAVGQAFLSFAPLFKLYTVFASHYKGAVDCMDEPNFQRFLKKLDLDGNDDAEVAAGQKAAGGGRAPPSAQQNMGMHRLRSALLLVLSRVPKYELMLEQLHTHAKQPSTASAASAAPLPSVPAEASVPKRLIKGAIAPSLLLPLEHAVAEVAHVDRFISTTVRVRENRQRLYEVEIAFGGRSKLALVEASGYDEETRHLAEDRQVTEQANYATDDEDGEDGGLVLDDGGGATISNRETVSNPMGTLATGSSWKRSNIVSGNNNSGTNFFGAEDDKTANTENSHASPQAAPSQKQQSRAPPPRTFIRAGLLRRVCKRRIKTFHYVLCSDLLMYGHSISPTQFKLHRVIGLAHKCDLREVTAATLAAVQDERKVINRP